MATEALWGASTGLGYYIQNTRTQFATSEMYAGILLAGGVVYVANTVLLAIEKWFLYCSGY